MKRFPHILSAGKNDKRPALRVFFDSESDPEEDGTHSLYLICANFVDERRSLDENRDYLENSPGSRFWADVANFPQPGDRLLCYAHNAGYDVLATGGILELAKRGYLVQSWFEKGSVFMMEFKNHYASILVLSTTNFYAGTLKKLGELFGVPKMDFDVFSRNHAGAVPYCRQDVLIIKKAMEGYFDFIFSHNFGKVMNTISGQAFFTFRRCFMEHEIFIHNHEKVLKLERAGFYGGRVELFQRGYIPCLVHYLDVNSMYPFCMRSYPVPVKYRYYRKKCSARQLSFFIQEYLVMARVVVKTDIPYYPFRKNNKLVFPIGEFETVLSTPELQIALDNGHITEIKEIALYDGAVIFENYIDTFYTMRRAAVDKGDTLHSTMYKLFMNGLYGKFGQLEEEWDRVSDAPYEDCKVEEVFNFATGEKETYKTFGGGRFKRGATYDAFNAFPAITAHVTAYARCLLFSYIEQAGRQNVFYCDTDSLFVNTEGFERLKNKIDPGLLGYLKLEKESSDVYLHAPKDYVFGEERKQKGVKKGAICLNEEYTEFEQQQWPKVMGQIRKGNLATYQTKKMIKKLSRNYTKGLINEDNTISPFYLTIEN
jgi:hypothetical protein